MSAEPLSRRREVGATSARSLLLTVLGELVLPAGRAVWTRALVDTLAAVGVEEKSARQALARTAADGVLSSVREGRRVRWSLSPAGHRLLSEGAARIYAHGAPRPSWDGRWIVLVASVPEQERHLRHQLRTRLAWAGLGSPAAGVWICPDPRRLAEVHGILDDAGVATTAFVVVGEYHGGTPAAALVGRAWDLSEVEARYAAFVDRFADLDPRGDAETLAAQIRLVDAWRRFPFLDPQLPDELLPERWAGHRAAALFHSLHSAWREPSRRHFAQLAELSSPS